MRGVEKGPIPHATLSSRALLSSNSRSQRKGTLPQRSNLVPCPRLHISPVSTLPSLHIPRAIQNKVCAPFTRPSSPPAPSLGKTPSAPFSRRWPLAGVAARRSVGARGRWGPVTGVGGRVVWLWRGEPGGRDCGDGAAEDRYGGTLCKSICAGSFGDGERFGMGSSGALTKGSRCPIRLATLSRPEGPRTSASVSLRCRTKFLRRSNAMAG